MKFLVVMSLLLIVVYLLSPKEEDVDPTYKYGYCYGLLSEIDNFSGNRLRMARQKATIYKIEIDSLVQDGVNTDLPVLQGRELSRSYINDQVGKNLFEKEFEACLK